MITTHAATPYKPVVWERILVVLLWVSIWSPGVVPLAGFVSSIVLSLIFRKRRPLLAKHGLRVFGCGLFLLAYIVFIGRVAISAGMASGTYQTLLLETLPEMLFSPEKRVLFWQSFTPLIRWTVSVLLGGMGLAVLYSLYGIVTALIAPRPAGRRQLSDSEPAVAEIVS